MGKTHIDSFKLVGARYLLNISTFFFKHLGLVHEAKELAESGLLLNFNTKAWQKPTARKDLWAPTPLHLSSAIKSIVLLSSMYVSIITSYKRRMDKKVRSGGLNRLYRTTSLNNGAGGGEALGRSVNFNDTKGGAMKEIGKGNSGGEGAVNGGVEIDEDHDKARKTAGGKGDTKLPLQQQPQVDVMAMKQRMDLMEVRVKMLEDGGLSESQVEAFVKFDENVDGFDEIFMTLPQSKTYKRAMVRSSWLMDKTTAHAVDLERLGDMTSKNAGLKVKHRVTAGSRSPSP